VKFGLAGTGYWARVTHAAALASEPAAEFTAVWGRSADKAAALGEEFGVKPYADRAKYADFVGHVDAVAFSVPPDVQAELAVEAARAGRHLLLEKPVATSAAAAERVAGEVDRAGVSSVVFFTARFNPAVRQWLAAVQAAGVQAAGVQAAGVQDGGVQAGGFQGGWARWFGSAFGEGSPYASSPWRREKGALWDVGPHALSLLTAALGPVTGVTADAGAGDLVHLVLHHSCGATSTASLTLGAPARSAHTELTLWGAAGLSPMPRMDDDPVAAYRVALAELVAGARAGRRSHPCDVRFGATVVNVLAEAEQQIAARRAGASAPRDA
jgi:predicted dehydrogenase